MHSCTIFLLSTIGCFLEVNNGKKLYKSCTIVSCLYNILEKFANNAKFFLFFDNCVQSCLSAFFDCRQNSDHFLIVNFLPFSRLKVRQLHRCCCSCHQLIRRGLQRPSPSLSTCYHHRHSQR